MIYHRLEGRTFRQKAHCIVDWRLRGELFGWLVGSFNGALMSYYDSFT